MFRNGLVGGGQVLKCVNYLARPFQLYLELTIAEPCKSLVQEHSGRGRAGCPSCSDSQESAKSRSNAVYFCKLLRKQRQMCSPKLPDYEIRDPLCVCQRYMNAMYRHTVTLEHLPEGDYLH